MITVPMFPAMQGYLSPNIGLYSTSSRIVARQKLLPNTDASLIFVYQRATETIEQHHPLSLWCCLHWKGFGSIVINSHLLSRSTSISGLLERKLSNHKINPAIALLCGKSEENEGKKKRTEPGNSESVLSGSPDSANIKPFLAGLKSLYSLKPFVPVKLIPPKKTQISRESREYADLLLSPW